MRTQPLRSKHDFFLFSIADSFDFSATTTLHTGLKQINDWPTFPQLIIKGEFVGGLDVVKEMQQNGELQEMLQDVKAE